MRTAKEIAKIRLTAAAGKNLGLFGGNGLAELLAAGQGGIPAPTLADR